MRLGIWTGEAEGPGSNAGNRTVVATARRTHVRVSIRNVAIGESSRIAPAREPIVAPRTTVPLSIVRGGVRPTGRRLHSPPAI